MVFMELEIYDIYLARDFGELILGPLPANDSYRRTHRKTEILTSSSFAKCGSSVYNQSRR